MWRPHREAARTPADEAKQGPHRTVLLVLIVMIVLLVCLLMTTIKGLNGSSPYSILLYFDC